MITSRRTFLTGLGAALITAPAIVRAGSLMPVKQMVDLPEGLVRIEGLIASEYDWVTVGTYYTIIGVDQHNNPFRERVEIREPTITKRRRVDRIEVTI